MKIVMRFRGASFKPALKLILKGVAAMLHRKALSQVASELRTLVWCVCLLFFTAG